MLTPEATSDFEPGLRIDGGGAARAWLRIGLGLAVAAQAMVFSLAVNIAPAEGGAYWLVHGGLIASAFLVLVFLGRDMMREAWSALRGRRVSIDLLFLTTLLGALGGSLISTFTGTGSVYYEVVSVLVAVHTLGKLVGARSRAAALRAADAVAEKFDQCTVVLADGRQEEIPVAQLRGGEQVLVSPGAPICVDGIVEAGVSYVEEAAMTGEWRPVARGPGAPVWAGTYAVDGRLIVRATGGPRRLDGVLKAVAEARLAPSQLQAQADRLMAWWLPIVTGVAATTFAGWLLAGATWDRALFNAMAVLLVACPCAMGLATPVAVWGGLARLAQLGIVARSGDFLTALARVNHVCFDKTGTLSEARLHVLDWSFADAWRGREAELQGAVVAVERGLPHPVARALVGESAVESRTASGVRPSVGVSDLQVVAGQGVQAQIVGLGRIRVGEPEFCGIAARSEMGALLANGGDNKAVWVAVDGRGVARIRLSEALREGLQITLGELRVTGLELEVLTGDRQAPPVLAADAKVPVRTALSPAEKAARVGELRAQGRRVLFAGDGVNDAAAMAGADAALALRSGSSLAKAAAMAVCEGDDLRNLPEAVRVSRAVLAGVRSNLRFAAGYNLAGMALAAAGLLHPVAAALLMVGSSVWVGIRALRSPTA